MSKSILCIGATLVDELYFCDGSIVAHSSNPAQKTTSIGGVVSNIVQHLALLDVDVALLTALGADADGDFIKASFERMGVDISQSVTVEGSTGKYVSILNPDGNLYVAVCQDITDTTITIPVLEARANYLKAFDVLLIDTNLAIPTLQWLIDFAKTTNQTLLIEPVSVPKAAKLATLNLNGVSMITPNQEELQLMHPWEITDEQEQVNALLQRGVAKIWLRKGSLGSVICQEPTNTVLGVPLITIVDSTGAGDAALAGWLLGYLQGEAEMKCLQLGHTLAFEVLKKKGSIDYTITKEKLYSLKATYYHD
ncbi:PfkB family carbohydrate kinase [Flavobacterium paronense]|uniref:PfkB family carbohydrate kinase n=1 Tax=Flavobacterium paronense TaxID=1392775 RepID=A0ABV5GCM1_9FLAO|nr:PfkB family carbohydrate kinase [Flavobacterium paronense]MDN3676299.1 PfkB family carbohydrate kinase [Flavobacterium paronense]